MKFRRRTWVPQDDRVYLEDVRRAERERQTLESAGVRQQQRQTEAAEGETREAPRSDGGWGVTKNPGAELGFMAGVGASLAVWFNWMLPNLPNQALFWGFAAMPIIAGGVGLLGAYAGSRLWDNITKDGRKK